MEMLTLQKTIHFLSTLLKVKCVQGAANSSPSVASGDAGCSGFTDGTDGQGAAGCWAPSLAVPAACFAPC
jgi:hypothetical protein